MKPNALRSAAVIASITPAKLLPIQVNGTVIAARGLIAPERNLLAQNRRNLVKIAGLRPPINLETNRPGLPKRTGVYMFFI